MARSTGQFVTVEHFDAAAERLDTRIDAVRTELQASFQAGQATMTRFLVIVAGVIIAANALMIGILRFLPRDVAAM